MRVPQLPDLAPALEIAEADHHMRQGHADASAARRQPRGLGFRDLGEYCARLPWKRYRHDNPPRSPHRDGGKVSESFRTGRGVCFPARCFGQGSNRPYIVRAALGKDLDTEPHRVTEKCRGELSGRPSGENQMKLIYLVSGPMGRTPEGQAELGRRREYLQRFAGPDTEVDITDIPAGPGSIESMYEEYLSIPETVKKAHELQSRRLGRHIAGLLRRPRPGRLARDGR